MQAGRPAACGQGIGVLCNEAGHCRGARNFTLAPMGCRLDTQYPFLHCAFPLCLFAAPSALFCTFPFFLPLGVRRSYFQVTVESVAVQGRTIPVESSVYNSGLGAVVDSGTTFTYVPHAAYVQLRDSVSDVPC